MRIQLEGEIRFGSALTLATMTDYSDEVSSLMLNFTRNQVERPPTYGVPRAEQRLGAETQQATINFFGDESEPTGLWVAFFEALRTTDTGELYFSAKYKEGVASATNPRFEGIIAIADMDAGTTVGEWKQQSKTYPARDVAGPLVTDLA
jgi:hypothetical protein